MVFDEKGKSLELRLKGTRKGLLDWGFEYLNHLSGEIAREYERRYTANCNLFSILVILLIHFILVNLFL